jgi:hypothetical protein
MENKSDSLEMMKVICVDNFTLSGKPIKGLTLGKIYDVTDFVYSSPWVSQIIDDNGDKVWFNDEVLISLEKYRDLKIKELGI